MAAVKEIKLYIDSNIFVYAAIDLGSYGQKARELISKICNGQEAFTLAMTVDEVLWVVQRESGRQAAIQTAKAMLAMQNLHLIPADETLVREAIKIFENGNLAPRDSMHLAALRIHKLTRIVSTDADFDKVKDIQRIPL